MRMRLRLAKPVPPAPLSIHWGDSLTAGTGASSVATSYGAYLANSYSPTHTYFNGGVGGDTSTQILTRVMMVDWVRTYPTVIWAGRNNYAAGATVQSDIAAIVANLLTPYYLVVSVINGNYPAEYAGQSDYAKIVALNSALATTYGSKFVDVRTPLVNAYNPAIPQDVTDHTNDIPPSSNRFDNIHQLDAGYVVVANTIKAAMVANSWPGF